VIKSRHGHLHLGTSHSYFYKTVTNKIYHLKQNLVVSKHTPNQDSSEITSHRKYWSLNGRWQYDTSHLFMSKLKIYQNIRTKLRWKIQKSNYLKSFESNVVSVLSNHLSVDTSCCHEITTTVHDCHLHS